MKKLSEDFNYMDPDGNLVRLHAGDVLEGLDLERALESAPRSIIDAEEEIPEAPKDEGRVANIPLTEPEKPSKPKDEDPKDPDKPKAKK